MILKDFACLLVNSSRAKAYLQKLVAHSFVPARAIYLNLSAPEQEPTLPNGSGGSAAARCIAHAFRARKYFLYSASPQALIPAGGTKSTKYRTFDPAKGILETLKETGIEHQTIQAASLNEPAVIEAVKSLSERHVLFSGGGILRREILSLGKKFIHIHPGFLPRVRGSMAIEWSVLLSERIAASAIFMTERIDAGSVLMTRFFDPPELDPNGIPPYFSSHIRSEVLVDLVQEYVSTGDFHARSQDPGTGETYYKMHPALNNIVFSRLVGRGQKR